MNSKPFKFLVLGALLVCAVNFADATETNPPKQGDTIVNSENLSQKQQSMALIASFTATGDRMNLKVALNDGLNAGLSINEIKEILVQMYAYTGFPRSLNALDAFMTTLEERKQKGIKDRAGKAPLLLPKDKSKLELGMQIQTELIGAPVKGAIYDFAPTIDIFLKEHLFGDIFGRGILDYQSREIATIAALASLDGVESQLRGHLRIGQNVGLTPAQEEQILALVKRDDGKAIFPKGEKAAADYFTGTAWVNHLASRDETGNFSVDDVIFEAGSRNHWHTHPTGQTLLVTEGEGWYQEWGKAARKIVKGDTVVIPANVKHWHGAAAKRGMTHIAITGFRDGTAVTWLEPVTDAQYSNLEK
ncbi:MAG: carboxymuconolactone decarboxylase family protein [Zoogloeaceae bacterium]|jgi:quercetin dioxygenase-like cupin family protein|nr:carboxymuconolactone decarboxylase family protein [Zoogloeaceae bacterium]